MGTALITGASAGLGVEYAWQLAAAGHDLVLVARRDDRLQSLASDLANVTGVNVEVLARDLADRSQLDDVADRLRKDGRNAVGLLVNNAGFGLGAPFLSTPVEEEEAAIDVMIRAVMVLSKAAAAAMIPRGRGAILNVSSIAQGTSMGTYAAHKAWVRVFTEALAGELRGTGVTATAVLPGLMHTEFHDVANMDASVWPRIGWIDKEKVVSDSLRAVNRGTVLSVPAVRYKVAQAALHLSPRSLVRVFSGPSMHKKSRRDSAE